VRSFFKDNIILREARFKLGLGDDVVLLIKHTKTMKAKFLAMLLSSMALTSCSEVLIEDYLAGTWELKTYLRNDVDESSDIHISYYEESYVLGETYSRRYVDGKKLLVEESGKFDINEDQMSIHISDVSSIADFSDFHSTLSSSVIHVETINETELIYSFENGGDTHEFRFIRK